MKTDMILRKLYREKREFVESGTIKEYCDSLSIDYDTAMRHLIPRGYLVRIFKGIFYVKSLEETKLGRTRHSPLQLVSNGLEVKGVENWYFGLYSALKLNNLTHEYFEVEVVINDEISRPKPMKIAGRKFRFHKVKSSLFSFGVVIDDMRYSDPEKTVLDFIYLWKYRGIPDGKIVMDLNDWVSEISSEKINVYANNYSKSVRRVVEMVIG